MGNIGMGSCCTDGHETMHERASEPDKEATRGRGAMEQVFKPRAKTVRDLYSMESNPLGRGSFGTVYRARDNATHAVRAIKAISKQKVKNIAKLEGEVSLMKVMDHPHITKLFDTFEDPVYCYLVLELCEGGELFELIAQLDEFTEREASVTMEQLLQSVYYMHSKHFVCHRDLKPENFLWTVKGPIEGNSLKLIDFGLSKRCPEGEFLSSRSGTALYVAPEILQAGKPYAHEVDLWSAGVILYCVLCGYPPFVGRNDQAVMKKVKAASYDFNGPEWQDVSEDAKSLIRCLLQVNAKKRLTAKEALDVKWIKQHAPNEPPGHHLNASLGKNLNDFRGTGTFKKAALQCVAQQLDTDKIHALGRQFKALDVNKDGVLCSDELAQSLKVMGAEFAEDFGKLLEEIDFDNSGTIDYTEFIAASLDRREYENRDLCWKAFKMFDRNGDGTISNDEIPLIFEDKGLQERLGDDAIKELMDDVDKNGDGEIDFEEFMTMMTDHGFK